METRAKAAKKFHAPQGDGKPSEFKLEAVYMHTDAAGGNLSLWPRHALSQVPKGGRLYILYPNVLRQWIGELCERRGWDETEYYRRPSESLQPGRLEGQECGDCCINPFVSHVDNKLGSCRLTMNKGDDEGKDENGNTIWVGYWQIVPLPDSKHSRRWPIKESGYFHEVSFHRLIALACCSKAKWKLMGEGAIVLHRCGDKRCVRPAHLQVGTKEINKEDHDFHSIGNNSMRYHLREAIDTY